MTDDKDPWAAVAQPPAPPAEAADPWAAVATANPEFGLTAAPETPGPFRSIGDLGSRFAAGAAGSTKALTDAAGADNIVSRGLQTATEVAQSAGSDYDEAMRKRHSERSAAADGKGFIAETGAALKNFSETPFRYAAEGAGALVPAVAGGTALRLLGAGTKGVVAGTSALGGAQGGGAVKGTVYDDVLKQNMDAGMPEAEARARADEAQAYGGPNSDQIALGVAGGLLAGSTGAEKVIGRIAGGTVGKGAQQGLIRQAATGAATEFGTEALQGGQEALAGNLAVQREGWTDQPTMAGVYGAAATEGLMGAGPGGAAGVVGGIHDQRLEAANLAAQQAAEQEAARQAAQQRQLQQTPPPPATPPGTPPAGPFQAPGTAPPPTTMGGPWSPGQAGTIDPADGPMSKAIVTGQQTGAIPTDGLGAPVGTLTPEQQAGTDAETQTGMAEAETPNDAKAVALDALSQLLARLGTETFGTPDTDAQIDALMQQAVGAGATPEEIDALVAAAPPYPTGDPNAPAPTPFPVEDDPAFRDEENADVDGAAAPPTSPLTGGGISGGGGTLPGDLEQVPQGEVQGPDPGQVSGQGGEVEPTPAPTVEAPAADGAAGGTDADIEGAVPGEGVAPETQGQGPQEEVTGQAGPFVAPSDSGNQSEPPSSGDLQPPAGSGQQSDGPFSGPQVAGGGTIAGDLPQPPRTPVDEAAAGAATSPGNDLTPPSPEQEQAGNYQKGHARIGGLQFSFENEAGSVRKGVDKDGAPWENTLADHYGYIRGTTGSDNEQMDAFVRPGTPEDFAGSVFVVDQHEPSTGTHDEHKVMVGYASAEEAIAAYHRNYGEGWAGFKAATEMPFRLFKRWVRGGPRSGDVAGSPIAQLAATMLARQQVEQPTTTGTDGQNATGPTIAPQDETGAGATPTEGGGQTGRGPSGAGTIGGDGPDDTGSQGPDAPAGADRGDGDGATAEAGSNPPSEPVASPSGDAPVTTEPGGDTPVEEPSGNSETPEKGSDSTEKGPETPETGESAQTPEPVDNSGGGTLPGDTTPPKPPKAEVTVETPVRLGSAKLQWVKLRESQLPDVQTKFAGPTWKTLDGVPHMIAEDGSAMHFRRDPANPKKLIAVEDYSSEKAASGRPTSSDPMEEMVAASDADGIAAALYKDMREVTTDDLPTVLAEDRLVRFPVLIDENDEITGRLKALRFKITDRLQETEAGRMMISATYKADKTSIGDAGEQMAGGRKDQNPPPPLPKEAGEAALDKFLEALHRDNFLDPDLHPTQTFGAMMFKEAVFAEVMHPLAFLVDGLEASFSYSYGLKPRAILKDALANDRQRATVDRLAGKYVERLKELQATITPFDKVAEAYDAFVTKYRAEDSEFGRVRTTALGLLLQSVTSQSILQNVQRHKATFEQNEDSTDQTHRVKKKDPDAPARLERIVRRGMKDHRQGKNVTEDDFKNTFGFRGVEFGNWVNQAERQANVNLAYDGLMDMVDLTGLSPKVIGLAERLGMAFGARGRGAKAAAHFEPDNNVINLTKTMGNGTVAHEWFHALDDNLARVQDPPLHSAARRAVDSTAALLDERLDMERLDAGLRATLRGAADEKSRNTPPKKAVFDAVRGHYGGEPRILVNTREATAFMKAARAMDEGSPKKYWSTPVEMLARGYETYIFDKAKGGTPYLVGPSRADGAMTVKNGYKGAPYPMGDERKYVAEVYQVLVDLIDGETLKLKGYEPTYTVHEVPGMGFTVMDQHGAGTSGANGYLEWHTGRDDAEASFLSGEQHLTPRRWETGHANRKMVDFATRIDAIMEEMGIIRWPELKDGSMAESMFFHLRQGWWPENNDALKEYAAKAYRTDKGSIDLIKLKQAQEDFEAALGRYAAQRVIDMGREGADERAIYDYLVGLYEKQPLLDVRTTTSATNQAYSTPLPIAYLANLVGKVDAKHTVLDPTAGNGLLVVGANPKGVIGIELEKRRATNLRQMEYGRVIEGDALTKLAEVRDQEADVVLANPPFGSTATMKIQSWDGRQYHISKVDQQIAALSMRAMADGGRAVLILGAHRNEGTVTSADRAFLNWLYSNYNVADHFEVDGKLYARQGTTWPLRVLVVAGRNQTNNAFDGDAAIDRVHEFPALWERFYEAGKRSERVVVGAGTPVDNPGGSDQGSDGVPPGDSPKADGTDRQGGGAQGGDANGGTGTGGSRPGTDGGTGTAGGSTAGTGGRGERGSGGRSGTGKGGDTTGSVPGGAKSGGIDAGGLSDLSQDDIDALIDGVFDGEPADVDPETGDITHRKGGGKKAGGTRTGGKDSGTPAPKPTASDVFGDIPGAVDILAELQALIDGKPQAKIIPADPTEPVKKPPKAKFARKSDGKGANLGQAQYAERLPILERLWEKLTAAIKDVAQRIKRFADGLLKLYGEGFRPHVKMFVGEKMRAEQRVPSGKKPVQPEAVDSETQVVYFGRSGGASEGIFVPSSQAGALNRAFDAFESEHGDVDDFVRDELGYADNAALYKAFYGYQIDALALAISSMRNGNGFIIGDDTGVGKGRTAAALISWANRNDKIPIFFSYKKDLYTSMYKDLVDIDRAGLIPMPTDGDAEVRAPGKHGKVIIKNNDKKAGRDIDDVIKTGNLPAGRHAIFTTYYQLNKQNKRRDLIRKLVREGKAVLIMDEAHNAAGESSTNEFFMQVLTGEGLFGVASDGTPDAAPDDWRPPATTYLTATFAKRPSNMPVYVRTNLRHAANSPAELATLFATGGDVMQQIASEMLVKSGSMIRRERSYAGVQFDYLIDEANAPRDARLVDQVTEVLRRIVYADRAFQGWLDDTDPGGGHSIVSGLVPPGFKPAAGARNGLQIDHNLFTSVVHNYVGQLLLATKIDKGVEEAVAAMNRGEKVVFALQNTMEAALEDYASMTGIKNGDSLEGFGWQSILQRGLKSSRRVTFNAGTGNKADNVRVEVPPNLLPQSIRAEFEAAEKLIANFQSTLPGSPIDMLRHKMGQYSIIETDGRVEVTKTPPAGAKSRPLNIVEITGRDNGVDYSGAVPVYRKREDPENTDTIIGYQHGGIDVVILNSSGSTGISLHASEEVNDQRVRHMIILQPNPDIAVFKQTIGRTHRTGQVEWPKFTVLATGIPAERRLLAVLKKKIASLSSNTSAGEGTTGVEAVDFINQYGDVITAQYLTEDENKDIAAFINKRVPDNVADAAGSDLALKASGRAALLSVTEQTDYFDTIEQRFTQEIEARNATGTNALIRRALDLQAAPIELTILEEGMDMTNSFTETAYLTKYEVSVIGDIPTADKVRDAINSALAGRSPVAVVDELVASLKTRFDEALNQVLLKRTALQAQADAKDATTKEIEALTERIVALDNAIRGFNIRREQTISQLTRQFRIGSGYETAKVGDVESQAVVVSIQAAGSTSRTGNPFTPSNIIIHLQRNVPNGRLAVPLSRIEGRTGIELEGQTSNPSLDDWFSLRNVSGGRKERYIAHGNLLRARANVKGGEIIRYTLQGQDPNGQDLPSGIMLPTTFLPGQMGKVEFTVRYPKAAVDYVGSVIHAKLKAQFDRGGWDTDKEKMDAWEGLMRFHVVIDEAKAQEILRFPILQGPKSGWALRVNMGGSPAARLAVGADFPKLARSKELKALIGDMSKRRGDPFYQSESISDPAKIAGMIRIIARHSPMIAPEPAVEMVRDLSKQHFKADNEGAKFRRGELGKGGDRTLPAVNAVVLKSPADAPFYAPVDAKGAFFEGKVYIFESNIRSGADLARVLRHEGTHASLASMFPRLVPTMNSIYRGNPEIRRAADAWMAANESTDTALATEEVLAQTQEERLVQMPFWPRLVAAIRNAFRAIGLVREWTNRDVLALLARASDRMTDGATGDGEARFNRMSDAVASVTPDFMRDRVGDYIHSERGFNVLHRTLSTQFHKSTVSPAFRKVFESVQRHIGFVNSFANEAADQAPTIFPKIKTLRDALSLKRPPEKDLEVVAKALFEGTLSDPDPAKGIVWTDPFLVSRFSMTPVQIKLYRETRAAIDKSLDDLGKTEMLRELGEPAEHMRQSVLDAADAVEAAEVLVLGMNLDIDDAMRVRAKATRIQNLKDGGYAPLMRFGRHSVTVRDDQGEVVSFELFEREAAANKAARERAAADPSTTVEQRVLPQEVYEQFAGISPDTLDVFADAAGMVRSEAVQEFLKLARGNRSASKRLIHRKGTAGYNDDVTRVLASFITSNARAAATALENRTMLAGVEAARKSAPGDVADEAHALVRSINNPLDPSSGVRGLMFLQYLGGSIASAAVNMTQPFAMTIPELSRHVGPTAAIGQVLTAVKDVATRKPLGDALTDAVQRAERDGHIAPQEIHHLIGDATPGFGGNHTIRRLIFGWGRLFSMAEEFNRRVTFIAAYRGALANGNTDPYRLAINVVESTQGIYNKGNRPNLARNPVGATVLVFKQYSIAYLEFLIRLPPREKLLAIAILTMMAGIEGLPFADDLDDMIDTLLQSMGSSETAKNWKRKNFDDVLLSGLPSGYIAPFDVSKRLGIGNLVPGSGLLLEGRGDKSREVAETLGVAGSFAQDITKAFGHLLKGDPVEAAQQVAPKALKDVRKALEMEATGQYRDSRGRKVVETDSGDAVIKGIGFQPYSVAKPQQTMRILEDRINFSKATESRIADEWAKGIAEKDQDRVTTARQQLLTWNRDNPTTPIQINPRQIQERVKLLSFDAAERQRRRTPKELRPLLQ